MISLKIASSVKCLKNELKIVLTDMQQKDKKNNLLDSITRKFYWDWSLFDFELWKVLY